MTIAEKFAAGEMTMRLSWGSGYQWCTFPIGEPCYTLLSKTDFSEVAYYKKRLFLCPTHKTLWDELQRPLEEVWADRLTPLTTDSERLLVGAC
jgi:hypothetical protein